MDLVFRTEMVRYLKLPEGEFRLTRLLPALFVLDKDGKILDTALDTEEGRFLNVLAERGLLEYRWFGRLEGHGYAVVDKDRITEVVQKLKETEKFTRAKGSGQEVRVMELEV